MKPEKSSLLIRIAAVIFDVVMIALFVFQLHLVLNWVDGIFLVLACIWLAGDLKKLFDLF
jgi:hypothetical protein